MLPTRLDLGFDRPKLAVYQGDEYLLRLPFTGLPPEIPFTGTWAAQWRREARAATKVDFDLSQSDLAAHVIVVRIAPEATRLMRDGVWDLQQTTLDGRPVTWFAGRVEVREDVTR